jgi:hypothetical protein
LFDAIEQELARRPHLTDELATTLDHPESDQSSAAHAGSSESNPSADDRVKPKALQIIVENMPGPAFRLEFVAKTLLNDSTSEPLSGEQQSRVLLGTPIYVADVTGDDAEVQ